MVIAISPMKWCWRALWVYQYRAAEGEQHPSAGIRAKGDQREPAGRPGSRRSGQPTG